MSRLSSNARYRLGVAARAVAAIGGGYLFTATSMSLLARLLPLDRADATIVTTLLAFTVYTCAVMWVFATASAVRAWVGLAGASALLALPLWMLGGSL